MTIPVYYTFTRERCVFYAFHPRHVHCVRDGYRYPVGNTIVVETVSAQTKCGTVRRRNRFPTGRASRFANRHRSSISTEHAAFLRKTQMKRPGRNRNRFTRFATRGKVLCRTIDARVYLLDPVSEPPIPSTIECFSSAT